VLTLAWESVPRARRRGTPSRRNVQRDIPRLRARGAFAHGGKSTQKRRSNLRFENPCAPSHSTHFDHISHANAVPCKFPLNVALSLLLWALPLSLWNARLHNFTSQRESIYKNSGQRPPPTFAASRQRRDL